MKKLPLDSVADLTSRLFDLLADRFDAAALQRSRTAMTLAERAHAGQTRKHGAPYLVHPVRVALVLTEEFDHCDADLIPAALLHDVLEDAPDRVPAAEIEATCGIEVLSLVEVVTSPPKSEVPDKAERNRLKAEKVLAGPRKAWYIKLADRIDNLRDACLLADSAGKQFRARYHDETVNYYLPMVEQLGDPRVRDVFLDALAQMKQKVISDGVGP